MRTAEQRDTESKPRSHDPPQTPRPASRVAARQYPVQAGLLVVLYFMAGKLALLVAEPPGLIVSIWPASGIALAAMLLFGHRLWPAVLLASFLVTTVPSLDGSTTAPTFNFLAVATGIGIGASLQAALGTWLIMRFVGYPTPLTRTGDVLRFLALGGPVSCLLGATWGTTTLWAGGWLTAWADYSYTWWTWWLGNTIGVFIVTPIVLMWMGSPTSIWRGRRLSVALPLGTALVIIVALDIYVSEREKEQIKLDSERRNTVIGDSLGKSIDQYIEVLYALESLFASSEEVTREEFRRFVDRSLTRVPGIHALSWNPRISLEERATREEDARRNGYPGFQITELDAEGRRIRAPERLEYITVYYIEPHEGNENALGYNVGSNMSRREALDAARDKGEPIATARITLVQETGKQAGILVFLPFYEGGQFPAELEKRRKLLKGYVTGVFRIGDVLASALAGLGIDNMIATLHDDSAEENERFLGAYHLGDTLQTQHFTAPEHRKTPAGARQWTRSYEVGGRKWRLVLTPNPEYATAQRTWSSWLVLAMGLLFTGSIGAFQLVLTGHATELSRIHSDLKQEISSRRRAQGALEESGARFRALVEHAPEAIVLLDVDSGHFVEVNTNAVQLFGLERDKLVDLGPADVSPPKQPGGMSSEAMARAQIERTLAGEVPIFEWTHRNLRENRDIPCEIRLVRLPAAGQNLVRGSITDISERKRAEAALFMEKERAQVTLHSIADAVITTDADGKIEFMNPVAEQLTGWAADPARGLKLENVLRIVNEDTRDPVSDPVARCLLEKKVVGFGSHTLLISRSGREYAIQDSAAPILGRDGEVLGVVLVFNDVTEARRLAREASHKAAHDALTGLINRREFEVRLERALESAKELGVSHALCYLDLDQFKVVNDTVGHVAGDELLKQAASRFALQIRAGDTLARIGGDEFSLILEHCPIHKALEIAENLVATLQDFRFGWEDRSFRIGVSIGVAAIHSESESTSDLLAQADVACYTAKDLGRNRVYAYQPEDIELRRRHTELHRAAELREALETNRFRLCCQPIYPMAQVNRGAPTDREILLRLLDSNGSLLSPGAFIPAAERYGLMPAIDRWVIASSLGWYANQPNDSQPVPGIAINLSGASLSDGSLLDFVSLKLDESSVPPDRVCFEITETAAINHLSDAKRFIHELKRRGCRFALDDFGSGLSSFNYLKHLPVDYLKIDGSFVRDIEHDPTDRAMVAAIHEVGHIMGISTVAECVESQAIVEQLGSIGVDYVQGYAIGIPVPLEDVYDYGEPAHVHH